MESKQLSIFHRKEKGVAGLEILMAAVVALFTMGFLIMIFALMGSNLADSTSDNVAGGIINNTTAAIGEVVTWYKLIITITVMVVLILLTVTIIRAIKSSGMEGAGGA